MREEFLFNYPKDDSFYEGEISISKINNKYHKKYVKHI